MIKPADLILYMVTPKSGWASKLVAIGELLVGAGRGAEMYSHVAVAAEYDGYQYEAKWPKTGLFPIDQSRPYEIWRVDYLNENDRRLILRWCAMNQGRWYNMTGLLTDGLLALRKSYVCSQFAGEAYRQGGVHFKKEGARVLSPNAIADYKHARKIAAYAPRRA